MEYRVTIAIPETNEESVTAIFDALVVTAPDMGPVMGQGLPDGPTDFVLGLDAVDVLPACSAAVAVFHSAVSSCDAARAADTTIIDLHAERVPDWELQEHPELQTA
ncbi:MAG: hypothetical protein QOH76_3133 [Thermoleophilaceae bacterium]|jgi:hypothetical protein|nr:hypothetical protein [Thermoleophilaceae bacterium]